MRRHAVGRAGLQVLVVRVVHPGPAGPPPGGDASERTGVEEAGANLICRGTSEPSSPGRRPARPLVELSGKGRVAVVGQGPLELAVVDAAQGQRR